MIKKDYILLVDKPAGFTSFDAVSIIKKKLNVRKAGHAGTLDKFASGLLIVCTGWTTKLMPCFIDLDKRYIATFQMGTATDTHDCEGVVVSKEKTRYTVEQIDACLQNEFTGSIMQIPPHYSAVKISGKRASDRVRRGEEVALAPRNVMIHSINILHFDELHQQVTLDIACSKGTYIRALARDVGSRLKTGAYVTQLRRTEVGSFSVDDAAALEECGAIAHNDGRYRGVCTPYDSLHGLGDIEVKKEALTAMKHGKPLISDYIVNVCEAGVRFKVIPEGIKEPVAIVHKQEAGYVYDRIFIEQINKYI